MIMRNSALNQSISIIIPVHNGDKTISKCINYCLRQVFSATEIIVIDDASTDNTFEICQSFGDKIKLLRNKTPQKPYKTRKLGIEHATGEWLLFIDADDYINKDALLKLAEKQAKSNADIVQMRVIRRLFHNKIAIPTKSDYNCTMALDACLYNETLFPVQCWGKLYRKILLESTPIAYDGFWGEDRIFNLPILIKCPKIEYAPTAVYNYTWGGNSNKYNPANLNEYKIICSLKIEFACNNNLTDKIPDIKKEMTTLLEYHVRQRINLGTYSDDENIEWLEGELKDSFWSEFKMLSAKTIYYNNKNSLSRKLKKIISRFL